MRWRMASEHGYAGMRRWVAENAELIERVHEQVIAAGKHCFVEKPLTLRADESRRLAATADGKGLVNQRQIGAHTESFARALRAALRWARPGDLVLFLSHEDRAGVMAHLGQLQDAGGVE